ncbi:YciI family protein [Streptacidiphilus anmyonensis]|uniref:YciI family protein n=1 Tax=Streptacidiphilus anmyonensis TaxID=405782 RepID=UPI0005A8518B|nr:YciI family protein [Streptacidiphilus anmyonensis]
MSDQPVVCVLATFKASAHATEQDFASVIDAELARAKELVDQGVIVHGYHRTDVVGAALIVSAGTVEAARDIFATLPAVAAGLVETEQIMPLVPLQLPAS